MNKERKRFSQNVKGIRNINRVPKNNQLTHYDDSGLFFGLKASLGADKFVGRLAQKDGHCLTVGFPGCGKTEGPVKATLNTWQERMIFVDIKGDSSGLADLRRQFRPERDLKVFNPTKTDTVHFDPYQFLKQGGEENLVRYARDVAQAILPILPDVGVNKVWTSLAQNLLTAAIIYYYGVGVDFNQTMIAVQRHSVSKLVL